ncbi:MAG: hypothetical protein ABI451_11300, partial [Dokdonella sp.]
DPQRKGLLYAGTELGVYVSFDDGDHWQPLQANLPRTSVRDIDVHGDDLVIATHGRGFWIMDSIAPLRQTNAQIADAEAWLYAPAPAVRMRVAEFTGTPLPKDEPMASNPPVGAAIDYVLKRASRKPIELIIRDSGGKVVRRYSSADAIAKVDATKSRAAPEWLTPNVALLNTPGMHRFIWPLRTAQPAEISEEANADGLLVPPGAYSVELVAAGQTLRQSLTVIADPRVKLSDADYAAQFAFESEIQTAQARLAVAQNEAKVMHKALAQQRDAAKSNSALIADIDGLDAAVVAAAGIVDAGNPNNAWSMPPRDTTSFRFIAETLGKLATAAGSADAAPTVDARTGYAAVARSLDSALGAWTEVKTKQLKSLNDRLRSAGKKSIPLTEPK